MWATSPALPSSPVLELPWRHGKRGLPDRPNDDGQALLPLPLSLPSPKLCAKPCFGAPTGPHRTRHESTSHQESEALRASASAARILASPTFAALNGAPRVRGRINTVGEPKLVSTFVERPRVEHLLAETTFH